MVRSRDPAGSPDLGQDGSEYPRYRSHYGPRTRTGWMAVILFLGLLALAEPPIATGPAARVEPWLFGFPFLYAYLLIVYLGMISVLVWAYRRGL